MVKALLFWEAQYGDRSVLEKIAEVHGSLDDVSELGDFVTESKNAGTLLYAIHSRSLDAVQYLVERLGTRVNTVFSNGLNGVHYSILKNCSDITRYLLTKYAEIYGHHVLEVLEESGGMVMTPLDLAIDQARLEGLQVLLEFYSERCPAYRPNLKQQSEMFKCLSDKTAGDSREREAKYQSCRLLFAHFGADISAEIRRYPMSSESLFSLCCEGADQRMLELLFTFLSNQVKCTRVVQKILVDTLLKKISKSLEFNFEIIQSILALVDDKSLLYQTLVESDKYRVMQPTDHDLKTAVFKPPTGQSYCKSISNAFFVKQQMLVKYDIIPENKRLEWMAAFWFHWLVKCFGKRPFTPASSSLRYLTFEDCLELTTRYYEHLLSNAFVDQAIVMDQAWFSDINVHLDADSRQRLTERFAHVYHAHKRAGPFSLKALARKRIRHLLPSLAHTHVGQLGLPRKLADYLFA